MNRDLWRVFHDGVLVRIDGCVPGDLEIELEIGYLRAMFDEPGDTFTIELSACTKFVYSEYEEEPTFDIERIQGREPEVLYVTSEQPLLLECVMGTLQVEYGAMRVRLPSGVDLSYEALTAASEKYWSEWRARSSSVA